MKKRGVFLPLLLIAAMLLPSLAAAASSADNVNPAGVFPIVKEPVTLKVACVVSPRVENIETNEYIAWLEEKTGIHLEFMQLSATDTMTQINLMLASGDDMPDFFWGYNFTYVNMIDYADAGYIIPLNGLIESYGDEYHKRLEMIPIDSAEAYLSVGDQVYTIPSITIAVNNAFNGRMFINYDWLEQLGMDNPRSLDQLHDALVAFRDKDPNGNGVADEIPMMGTKSTNIISVIGCGFQNTSTDNYLKVEDGKVSFIGANESYQKTLRYIHGLIQEKLLAPATFTQDSSVLTALFSGDTAIVGLMADAGKNIAMDNTMPLYTSYMSTLPWSGPEGYGTAVYTPNSILRTFFITSACKQPEAAYRLADLVLSEEASMRCRYGVPGRDWDYVTDAAILSRIGEPAKYVDHAGLWSKASQNTILRSDSFGTYLDAVNNLVAVHDRSFANEYNATISIGCSKVYEDIYPSDAFPTEPLLSADDSIRFAELKQIVVDFMAEYNIRFVTGDLNLEADWDNYIKSLHALGVLDEYVALGQKAVDTLQ